MLKHSTRRWLAGLGVAGAFVAASATPTFAAPAAPAPRAENLDLYANSVIVAPGGTEKWVNLFSLTTERQPGDYSVKVDRSKIDDFADVENTGDDCTEAGAILTCKVEDRDDDGTYLNFVSLLVRAKADAKPDQRGELTFTVTPNGKSGSVSYSSTVEVGEGVDLTTNESLELKGTPGATLKAPLRVTNRGEVPAEDAVLYVVGADGLQPSKRYENCEYTEGTPHDFAFVCRFDTTIGTNSSFRLDDSFGFTVPADTWAPNTFGGFSTWFTPADWDEYRSEAELPAKLGPTGTEGELKLEPVVDARRSGQTDVNPIDNSTWIDLRVTGNQRADVVARGATVTGDVGTTVALTVGYVNNGPAAVNTGGGESPWIGTTVTLPNGVTAVRAPENCFDSEDDEWEPGKPGARVYYCYVDGSSKKGDKVDYAFQVRIDKAGEQAGEVTLRTGREETEIKDLNPANDTAQILVNSGGDGGQGGGGDGGALPITGQSTGLIAGLGALLLAAGVGGYLVARRRRTRFVA
ncbi:LPXTG cell wall anchor domain-containing protein [Micromonospora sp. WMMD1120]|uniref:LPXTG cell wall anchor domain-containing protein n=1 Tax=Micromonospora sp. WMMD1120 TaxID=3016106 RepID=UPI002415B25C|nr:LPXTG cell wall anchor domain-containing protein [Micromonospora sp. WMMD1120]MDG4807069.1 LPXTG cell wall anchor domain-containing protein [Micromonospora sp. WMMD1120]